MPLPEAYRSLSRPSSAPDAKAFPLRSYSLNLSSMRTPFIPFPRPALRRTAKTSYRSAASPLQRKLLVCVDYGGTTEWTLHLRHWFSELCRLISGSFFYEIVTHFLSSTFASEFPSVALLVFPLFSFQCADRRCKLRIFRSGARARAHSLRCISSSTLTFVCVEYGGTRVLPPGGLKWTRTTDLTIISRVL